MNTLHKIDKLTFAFTMDGNEADPLQVKMQNEVSSYLLPVIEEVFDVTSFIDYDIKIDKLTIDLGTVKVENSSVKGCALRLKKKLEDELKKRIQNSHCCDCIVVPRRKSDEKMIVQYLLTGIFIKGYFTTPDYLLEEILRTDSTSLITFLINNRFNDSVIRRLVWQFKIESVEKIIRALNQSDHEFILEFLNKIKKLKHISREDKRVVTSDSSMYHRQILEFTLKYSLCERQVQFNRIDFVQTMLLEISHHYNIGIAGYIDAIMDSLECTSLDAEYKRELVAILTMVQSRYVYSGENGSYVQTPFRKIKDSDQNDKSNNHKMKKFSQYAIQFLHLLDSGSSKEQCGELWELMIRASINDTISFLYYHCTSRRIIRNFVQLIDTEKINECIKMLAPDNLKFIHMIITTTDTFIKSPTVKKQPVTLETSRHKHFVYEFIIEYLIRQKNGVFSERIFTHGILVAIANHHNIAYTSLIVIMLEFLINEARVVDEIGYSQLVKILQLLYIEYCKKKIPHRLAINSIVTRQIEIVELFEHCRQFLLNDSDDEFVRSYDYAANFDKDLKKVYLNRPDLIHNLFQTLKTDTESIGELNVSCRMSICTTLLNLFIETIVDRYRHIQWNESKSETLRKIQQYVKKIMVNGYRCENILISLIEIDFTKISYENQFFENMEACLSDRNSSISYCNEQSNAIIKRLTKKQENGNDRTLSLHSPKGSFEIKNSESQNDQILIDDLFDEDFEKIIKPFFLTLHTESVLPKIKIAENRKIIETLIRKTPHRLRMWLKLSASNYAVVENLSRIVTEQQFLQLLLLMGSHTASVMYNYYIFIAQSLYTSGICTNCEENILSLKKVILDLVFKLEVQFLNDEEIRLKTGAAYLNIISDQNEKLLIKKITDHGTNLHLTTDVDNSNVYSIEKNITDAQLTQNENRSITQDSVTTYEFQSRENIIEVLEKKEILVTNAGIVIGAAYFERLFTIMKLIVNKKFVDEEAIQKAVKVLHYFATNRNECCEYEVSLNKIFCGVPVDFLLDPNVDLSESDKEITDSLVDAIITNWPVMKNTSRDSFRETFLKRRGYISFCDGEWKLQVEKQAFDMLIERLPWGFSMVKFPWMEKMVQVEWKWE